MRDEPPQINDYTKCTQAQESDKRQGLPDWNKIRTHFYALKNKTKQIMHFRYGQKYI